MPAAAALSSHEEKSRCLRDLFTGTYLKDVLECNHIANAREVPDILPDILASGIGSLTNPGKLSNTFKSEKQIGISSDTIDRYLGYFMDSFLIGKAERYDVKKKYIRTPAKYCCSDVGVGQFLLNETLPG